MAGDIIELTDETFAAAALQAGTRVVVDFWAQWCAPCVGISRRLEEQAPHFKGKLLIVKVNADDAPETAAKFGVRGLPTLVFLKDGKMLDKALGSMAPHKLDALLKKWSES